MAPVKALLTFGIEVKVTERCNQQCFHCVNEDGQTGKDLDCNAFIRRLHEWKKVEVEHGCVIREVRMTGGEPLMNPAAVARIARACRAIGIKSGINTNALPLDLRLAGILKRAGLSLIKVSYDAVEDGALKRIRGKQASMAKLDDSISTIVSLGFELVLRFSLCRYNADQLPLVYHRARTLRATRLQIKPLICSGRARFSDAFLTREEINGALAALASRAGNGKELLEILCWPPEDCSGLPGKLCGSVNKLYVTTAGETTICNYVSEAKSLGNFFDGNPGEIFVRNRESLTQDRLGNYFVKGCPQTPYFGEPDLAAHQEFFRYSE